MNTGKSNLKVSNIKDHNNDIQTDKLYDPLRTVVMDPETAAIHKMKSPIAAKKSAMHDRYEPLTPF